jgi:hypothetical protein
VQETLNELLMNRLLQAISVYGFAEGTSMFLYYEESVSGGGVLFRVISTARR